MNENKNRETIDLLVKHFWQNGYLTVSRKCGTYLPAPAPVGNYSVDAIGRYNKKYAIGIILSREELTDSKSITKLDYLATRHTRFSNKRVSLFAGVEEEDMPLMKDLLGKLSPEARRNIKLVSLSRSTEQDKALGRSRFRLNFQ